MLAAHGADVTVDWMPNALAAREAGVPMVNIAQVFDRSRLMRTCRRSRGVGTPKDPKGKTLGVWSGGNEYPFQSWMGSLGYRTSGAAPDVKVLKQGFNVDPLLQNQAARIATMLYNEYRQVVDAGIKPAGLVNSARQEQGAATLEDGLHAREPDLKDPAYVAKLAKFVEASLTGSEYALKNQDEAVKIVLAADMSGAATSAWQKRRLENIAKPITAAGKPTMGELDPAAYQRTVKVLLAGGSDPVIKKDPGLAARTHAVRDKAMGK
ncbi:MAG: ABC transporter substrate-binding protein [Burkholderiaceae bacterium]